MRKQLAVLALLSVASLVTTVTAAPQNQSQNANNLTVHEWGTFTSVAGADGAALQWFPLNGPSELPCFVKQLNTGLNVKVAVGGLLNQMKATVRMETPVVYFYSPQPMTVQVSASFASGAISEWYPQASVSYPSTPLSQQTGTIRWPSVQILPAAKPQLVTEDGLSHYYAARETDSAPIQVGSQMEKFLFYRGIADMPVPLTTTLDAHGAVVVANSSASPISTAILFERRGDRLGYSIATNVDTSAVISRPALTKDVAAMRKDLQAALVGRGLYPREADAMIETWSDSWFTEGARLFYIVPKPMLESMLPLSITPTPAEMTRVFVGRMEIFTPEVQSDVERAIRHNDLPALTKYGRFLEPIAKTIEPRFAPSEQGQITTALRAVAAWYTAVAAERACK